MEERGNTFGRGALNRDPRVLNRSIGFARGRKGGIGIEIEVDNRKGRNSRRFLRWPSSAPSIARVGAVVEGGNIG